MSAEENDPAGLGSTSETGQRAAVITINGPVYGQVMIGDNNEMTHKMMNQTNVPAYEEIGQPTGPRHFPDVCQDCEHTNKETGLVCHSCGGTRRNTNDCTREFKLVKREERKELTISEPLPNFRSRAQQIQQANPKRDNHLYGDVYAAGAIHGPWSPAPNCRITNYPPEQTKWENCEEFVQHFDRYLEELPNATKEENGSTEQFLLHVVLPNLERSCTQHSSSADVAVILAKLGCAGIGNSVTTHALELLLKLVTHNKLNRYANKLQQIERVFRDSIVSTKGAFEKELLHQQQRRLVLYSRLLLLSLIERAANGKTFFFLEDEKELREHVVAKLDKLFGAGHVYRRKPHLKLAIEVISEAVERLFSTSCSVREQHETFLQELVPLLDPRLDQVQSEKKWKTLQRKLCNTHNTWFDVVILIYYINIQETMYPTKTVIMLCRLVDAYMATPESRRVPKMFKSNKNHRHSGPLLTTFAVLFHIGMTQKDKNVRKEAVMSLVKYMAPSCAKSSCSPFGAVDEIKRYVGMCLFGKDLDTRTLLAYHLFDAQDLDKEIPQEYLEHYLQWVYRKHSLEMNGYTVNDTHSRHFTRGGCFRGVPAVVKTLKLKVREISQPGTVTSSTAQRDLINEAYCLNKLNAKPHPNILRVLAFNTAKPPYHVITEFMSKGTVGDYLQSCWLESDSLPSQSTLIKICQDVVEAAKFLSKLHLVHRGLTAANVFIGEDGVCKVAGTTTVRPLTNQDEPRDASEEEAYATPIVNPPEFVSKEEDYPVTHAALECIKEGRFSTASDVYAFGVFMWEVFTYGCPAYSKTKDGVYIRKKTAEIKQHILEGTKPPKEDCFHEEIYSLMDSCWTIHASERPSLNQLSKKLHQLHSAYNGTEYERPPATPPCSRSDIKLNRLPSPLCTPEHEQNHPEFSRNSFTDPTAREELLNANGATAGYLPHRQQAMNAGLCGYMPLIQTHGGEYQSRHPPVLQNGGEYQPRHPPALQNGGEYQSKRPSTKNTGCVPGLSAAPFTLGKPPAPRNSGSSTASCVKQDEPDETTSTIKKTSEESCKAVITEGVGNKTNRYHSAPNLRQRIQTLGKQVFPEGLKLQISTQCYITEEPYNNIGPLGRNAASCQAQDTFIPRPLPPEPTDQQNEAVEELYEAVDDVRAQIAALQLKNNDQSSQFTRLTPDECYSNPITSANAARPVQLYEDKELTEDDAERDTGYYDNICEGEGESVYEPMCNEDSHIYDDVMPAVQRFGAENGLADYVNSPPHCACAVRRPDSGFGSQDTDQETDLSDEGCGAEARGDQDARGDQETYEDVEPM